MPCSICDYARTDSNLLSYIAHVFLPLSQGVGPSLLLLHHVLPLFPAEKPTESGSVTGAILEQVDWASCTSHVGLAYTYMYMARQIGHANEPGVHTLATTDGTVPDDLSFSGLHFILEN